MVTLEEFIQHAVLVRPLMTVGYDTPDVARNLSLPPGPIVVEIESTNVAMLWDLNGFKVLIHLSKKNGFDSSPAAVQGNIIGCALALHWAKENGLNAQSIVHKAKN